MEIAIKLTQELLVMEEQYKRLSNELQLFLNSKNTSKENEYYVTRNIGSELSVLNQEILDKARTLLVELAYIYGGQDLKQSLLRHTNKAFRNLDTND